MSEQWEERKFDNAFRITMPPSMSVVQGQGIDSDYYEWQGNALRVALDISPFADPLNSYEKEANYTSFSRKIDGRMARIVSFDKQDGTHFVGAHFPEVNFPNRSKRSKMTLAITSHLPKDDETPMKIIESIKLGPN